MMKMPNREKETTECGQINQRCIADKMRFLNRMITNIYDDTFRPLGITTSQMNILVVVGKFGSAAPGQVEEWLHMEKSTLSRNADRMRKNGWLDIVPEGRGRSHRLELTSKGKEVMKKGLPCWERAQRKTRSLLGERGVEELVRVANQLRKKKAARAFF